MLEKPIVSLSTFLCSFQKDNFTIFVLTTFWALYSVQLKAQHSETKDHGIWSHQWQIDGRTVETVADFIFWAPKSLQMVPATVKLKDTYSLEENYDQPRQHIKKAETLLCQQRSLSSNLWFFQ